MPPAFTWFGILSVQYVSVSVGLISWSSSIRFVHLLSIILVSSSAQFSLLYWDLLVQVFMFDYLFYVVATNILSLIIIFLIIWVFDIFIFNHQSKKERWSSFSNSPVSSILTTVNTMSYAYLRWLNFSRFVPTPLLVILALLYLYLPFLQSNICLLNLYNPVM